MKISRDSRNDRGTGLRAVVFAALVGGGLLALVWRQDGPPPSPPDSRPTPEAAAPAVPAAPASPVASAPSEAPAPAAASSLPEAVRSIRPGEDPASPAEIVVADSVLARANAFFKDLHSVQDPYMRALRRNADLYEREYRTLPLPNRPANPMSAHAVPKELDPKDADAAERFRADMGEMAAALGDARAASLELRKYDQDRTIRDDGVLGRELVASIRAASDRWIAARDRALALADAAADEAEEILLRGHILKPQIVSARLLIRRMNQAPSVLAAGTVEKDGKGRPDVAAVRRWRQDIDGMLKDMALLPFALPGEIERAWRGFLNAAEAFPRAVEKGENTGFDDAALRGINGASAGAKHAYNAFAEAANELVEGREASGGR